MGSPIRLTNRVIKDLEPPANRTVYVHDDSVTGFCVAVTPRGAKSFYWYGRENGRPRRIRIGGFPELNTDDARKIARSIIGDVASGKSVSDRKRTGRLTIDDLFLHWLQSHAKTNRKRWQRDEREYERLIKPVLGSQCAAGVKRDTVRRLIADVERERGRGAAGQAHGLLSAIYGVAVSDELVDANPVRGVERPRGLHRQRYLKPEEVATFLNAVEALHSDTAKHYFQLCLFTGMRKGNVASMRWDEIDATSALWIIPAAKAKAKKPLVVPLSTHAAAIIESRRGNGSEWVFPGKSPAGHYSGDKDAWEQVRKLSGIGDLRVHDLRRSSGAWMQRTGASLRTIQLSLGHSDPGVTAAVYSPTEHEQIRAASQTAMDALLAAR